VTARLCLSGSSEGFSRSGKACPALSVRRTEVTYALDQARIQR
jgi:hypothetical protein